MLAIHRVIVGAVFVALIAAGSSGQTSHDKLPARFTAFAVSTGGPNSNATASQVEIAVERWFSQAESE